MEIPLLNSFILVSSGFTVTLLFGKLYLILTIFLGVYFTSNNWIFKFILLMIESMDQSSL